MTTVLEQIQLNQFYDLPQMHCCLWSLAASLVIDVIGGIITAVDTITVSMAASVTMTSAAIHVITAIISCHHQMSSLRVLTGNQINNQLWIK